MLVEMVTITLNRYRLGMITGVLLTFGFVGLFQGVEVLLFNGLFLEWTTRNAVIAIGIGSVYFALAYIFHKWSSSVTNLMEVEAEQ